MAEDLYISLGSRREQYETLFPQVQALLEGESNAVANMANMAAALKEQFGWLWVGFYCVEGDELVLGPFQGPVACTRIKRGRGVCGKAWADQKTLIVPDVALFPGHIACSSLSRSEIVVPFFKDGHCVGVLDADSSELDAYSTADAAGLEKLVALLG
jgi:GAF domain-containing protein